MWVRIRIGRLDRDDGLELLDAAGVASEYVELDPQPLDDLGCGQRGAKHQVPGGAKRRVCEQCGHTLDLAKTTVPYSNCSAAIALPTLPTPTLPHACSYSDAQISL